MGPEKKVNAKVAHYEITLRDAFSAAHQLRLQDGTLEPMHGHNWRVEATLEGPRLDETGILADFTVLQPRLNAVTAEMHNTLLNDHPAFVSQNPSTELIARHIHDRLAECLSPAVRVTQVRVWETAECAAAYIP